MDALLHTRLDLLVAQDFLVNQQIAAALERQQLVGIRQQRITIDKPACDVASVARGGDFVFQFCFHIVCTF
ncbi:MAG: hypothetical protein A2Y38_05580 [Spirochaetes bacterium GWB1_59_5]|nr:MAG: hypothetical protein A2Y38_05580 [Spirochaetes bacterium GWB1_59_5]